MLTLKLSASGKAALAKAGALKLNLNIEFSPANGKPANQSVPLTRVGGSRGTVIGREQLRPDVHPNIVRPAQGTTPAPSAQARVGAVSAEHDSEQLADPVERSIR
jgi:hypothetical protein